MKVALTCIAKDEDFYLEEWLEYNRKLGFDHIFIYENDWKCNIDLPYITKIQFPGTSKQLPAYNHFITTYKNDFDYVAFFDCDEFLVLKQHNSIQNFLIDYNNENGIGINWQLFGSEGKLKRESNSLLKQFTKRQNEVNEHVKTILNLNSKGIMTLPHNPNISIIDTNRKSFSGPFNNTGNSDVAIINHYKHKTREDWEVRCKRGRADCSLRSPMVEWDNDVNKFIDVVDLTALNFMYP